MSVEFVLQRDSAVVEEAPRTADFGVVLRKNRVVAQEEGIRRQEALRMDFGPEAAARRKLVVEEAHHRDFEHQTGWRQKPVVAGQHYMFRWEEEQMERHCAVAPKHRPSYSRPTSQRLVRFVQPRSPLAAQLRPLGHSRDGLIHCYQLVEVHLSKRQKSQKR